VIGYDYGYLWEYEEFDAPRLLEVMADFNAPWWVAGGWALDLWMERETRPHHDVDIAILRGDQQKLYRSLSRWELYYATPDHKLLPLRPERWLRPPIHGVWARRAHDAPWLCEFLLNEHTDSDWMYREDPAVRMPLVDIGITASDNIPIQVPEIVLLYKAHERTEKDEADFLAAFPHLSAPSKSWLLHALNKSAPSHPWIAHLRTDGQSY
jgi:Aminoglycoside-2''-adenylyltransferase